MSFYIEARTHRWYLIPSVCLAREPRDYSYGGSWHLSCYFLIWKLRFDF